MDAAAAIFVLFMFWGAPMLHVALARDAGPWRAPPGSGCPFSPRVGWLVIVLLLGPLGWLMFRAHLRRKRARRPRPHQNV
ncbi:MAG: hypothetical protein L6R19_15555 [Alphaproteobacteria bacterium]|nr:hypothetical protein [Alphaproteobacteria bacterium]